MKAIFEFFQSLGTAEYLITIAIIVICVIAWFDCSSIDKRLDDDIKWIKKRYGKKKKQKDTQ